MMKVDVAFGKRLRELRKRCGITQAELASRSPGRLDMQSVSRIELGFPHEFLRSEQINNILYGGLFERIKSHRTIG